MAIWALPAARVQSGATNITHSTNFNPWSTAAPTQLTAYQLLANQMLAAANILPGPLPPLMTHLHLGFSLFLLRTLSTLLLLPLQLGKLGSFAHFIHRGSGPPRFQHLPHGSPTPSIWPNSRPPVIPTCRTANLSNIRSPSPAPPSISLALLNCRSLSNKSPFIFELLLDNNLDLLLLCETWQQPLAYYALNQTTPSNYSYIPRPRLCS